MPGGAIGWLESGEVTHILIAVDLARDPDFDIRAAAEQAISQCEADLAEEMRAKARPAPARSRLAKPDRACAVYRLYNEGGDLLYVGKSINPESRLRQHERRIWWKDVTQIVHQWFDSEADALRAEDAAIRDENPLYNRIGGGR